MTTVVDASVAIKFSVEEVGSAAACDQIRQEPDLVAPDLLLIEAANAYWAMVRASRLPVIHAERNLQELPLYFTRLYPTAALVPEAFGIAVRLRHPVYDCIYLALATKLQCRLITADRKLHQNAVDLYPIDLLPVDPTDRQ